MVQLSHPYMTTGKTIALTVWTFAGKVMSMLSNTLLRFVTALLPRSKHKATKKVEKPPLESGTLRYPEEDLK